MIVRKNYSIHDFYRQFSTDDVCLEYILKERFDGFICPKCNRKNSLHRETSVASYVCTCGRTHIFPKKETLFSHSQIDLSKWFLTLFLVANSRKGINSKEIERQVGVTYKSAWRMTNLIRKLIAEASKKDEQDVIGFENKVRQKHHNVAEGNLHLYLSEFAYRKKNWNASQNLFFLLLSLAIHQGGKIANAKRHT